MLVSDSCGILGRVCIYNLGPAILRCCRKNNVVILWKIASIICKYLIPLYFQMLKVIFKVHCGSQYFGEAFLNNCAFRYFKIERICKTIPKFIETYFLSYLFLSLFRA